jgi:two-component system chemotaxis sensor kinase CheA
MTDKALLEDFIAETGEHLEDTERNLMRLDKQPDDTELLNDIFRSIHTIKGSSEYLGLGRIARLSHKLENLLDLMRRGEVTADSDVVELLISTNDRLGVLLDELERDQVERSEIDDLLGRIETYCGQPGSASEAGAESGAEVYEDEYDEELLGIFIEQLREGLGRLSQEAEQLRSGRDGQDVLERCLEQLETLQSSANYMGYDDLKGKYEQWSQSVEQVRDQLAAGQSLDFQDFADTVIIAGIDHIKSLFPKVFDLSEETAAPPAMPSVKQEAAPAPESIDEPSESEPADTSLLEDFIVETGEHLEEIERNLMRLDKQPDDASVLNEIFRSIHTIKGSSEYLGMQRIAELTHKLENLLEILRLGEGAIDSEVVELLIAASDRISVLMDQIEQDRTENAPIDDLIQRVAACEAAIATTKPVAQTPSETLIVSDGSGTIYSEVYDEELFSIFIKQLKSGLQLLRTEAEKLREGQDLDSVLDPIEQQLKILRSSANYMEYDELKAVYDGWIEEIAGMQQASTDRSAVDLAAYADSLNDNINKVTRFFPVLRPPEPESESDDPEKIEVVKREKAGDKVIPSAVDEIDAMEAIASAATESVEEIPADDIVERKHKAPSRSELEQMFAKPDDADDPDFDSVTLDQLEIEDDTHPSVGGTDTESDPDNLLRNKLEKAFDIHLGGHRIKEQVKLSVDIERILLSDDLPTRAQQSPEDRAFELTQRKDGGQGVESLLFSGMKTSKQKGNLPQTYSGITPGSERTARQSPGRDEGRGRYNLGRRKTDKIRERMIKQSIRVDAAKIDGLMNQVGELVVSRSGFAQLFAEMRDLQFVLKQSLKLNASEMQKVKEITNKINEATISLGRVTSELQENVMKVRMLPIAQLFSRYPRLVHDLVKNTNKKVSLEIHGEDTELDKMVIEQIADPLVHIIRNAVDHGIEDVGERLQKGKSEEGTLRLEAYHESNYVVIEISDDGRGIDPDQIRARALEQSFVDDQEIESYNEQEILALIMHPGFSTARQVTTTSGRGVGMDVVKDNIEKLNGTIDILSRVGAGVTFRVKIPLTLAIIPALMVRVESELFTIPLPTVDETLRIHRDDISTIEGMEVYYLRENTVPLIRLAELFNMRSATVDPDELFVVIVNTGAKQFGLVVDQLKAREEVVIKPLEDYLQEKSGFSGATILGDGSISLIVDVPELVQLALGQYISRTSAVTA